MRSLFLRFFLSFWLIIGIIITAAATGGYWYAERVREAVEDFELSDSMLAASAALESGGREGLAEWLRDRPATRGITLFVIDDNGVDLLERRMSAWLNRAYKRHQQWQRSQRGNYEEPRNLRRSRHLPQLVAANGATFTFFVSTSRIPEAIWGSTDVRLLLLIFALLVSGSVSYALASAIARPVRKLRNATITLADGDLNVRVANTMGRRRDELGMLGHDFDAMASKLQQAAEQQTELSRNISHELRSPLARMRVAVELARSKAGDLSEFARLDAEAERLDALIGQILSYTKLDAQSPGQATRIDLADVLNEVAENVNFECRSVTSNGVSVNAKLDGPVFVNGHRDALVSAIENIVRNAVRHSTPDSEVEILLQTAGNQVKLSILDSGSGVDPSEIDQLFEPFFRTRESSQQDSTGGTGLGLAIARRAILLHDGSITARNRDSGGLDIQIVLPRQPGDSAAL